MQQPGANPINLQQDPQAMQQMSQQMFGDAFQAGMAAARAARAGTATPATAATATQPAGESTQTSADQPATQPIATPPMNPFAQMMQQQLLQLHPTQWFVLGSHRNCKISLLWVSLMS